MSANVSAVLSRRADALTIPNEAVFVDGSQPYVFVVKGDSTVTKTAVTLGTRQPDVVEVLSGLTDDMSVVRAGHQKLYEGAKILPVTAEAAGAAPADAQGAGAAPADAKGAGTSAAEGASR
jgi:membrane fusion protein (multidrug efflux system)